MNLFHLPIVIALLLVGLGGAYLLDKADKQARDTIRKHHLEDIERSLYFARSLKGTYPPYEQGTWCGVLNAPGNEAVLAQLETALRAQHEKYANPAKPFPADPLAGISADYFYWKRSPSSFELYAGLEAAPSGERSTADCPAENTLTYDYGIASAWRANRSAGAVTGSPL